MNRAIFMSTVYRSMHQSAIKDDKSTKLPSNLNSMSINRSVNMPIVKGISMAESQNDAAELKESKKNIF